MRNGLSPLQVLVRNILENHQNHKWVAAPYDTYCIYFKPESVLNLYFGSIADGGTHSHPYDFRSEIVVGVFKQRRYTVVDSGGELYQRRERSLDGKIKGDPTECRLLAGPLEVYQSGDMYELLAPEIHRVSPDKGTLTFMTRQHKTKPASFMSFRIEGACAPSGDGVLSTPAAVAERVKAAAEYALEAWF